MNSESTPAFTELALAPAVLEALQSVGYETPSPIQAASIPHLLAGHDVVGMAQTGTGKTAAFALPALSKLDAKQRAPQVLVLTPTRELAMQVAKAFETYASAIPGFHVLPIYGGQSMGLQLKALKRGPQVIVGTPGRVMDHLRRKTLDLSTLNTLVLDEADEMLRMGFIEDVTWILDHTPEQRQIALFSATMPKAIREVAERYLNQPKEVKIKTATATVEQVEQSYWLVKGTNKLDALTRILEVETYDGVMLFVRTKHLSTELADKLQGRGFRAQAINGDLSQAQRERTIAQLKQGAVDILVATDVAARGIDVPRISHVINYDIPYDSEAYVHRIGRTGRAGRAGKAILFVSPRERRLLRAIEKTTRQPIQEMTLPTRQQAQAMRTQNTLDQARELLANTDNQPRTQAITHVVQEYLNQHELTAEQLAAALVQLTQGVSNASQESDSQPAEQKASHSSDGKKRDRKPTLMPRERSEHKPVKARKKGKPQAQEDDVEMEGFRIAVGRNQQATPGDIVGAIANEADIDSRHIGQIILHDDYSTVELPVGMPREIYQHLRRVRVRNHPLQLERMKGALAASRGKNKRHAEARAAR